MSMEIRALSWGGVLLLVACAGRTRDVSTLEAGTLGLQLRTEVNHVAYRLRDGVFEVTGPQLLTLNSEEDVDASSLEGTLAAGAYDVELLPGWRLERESASGFETLDALLTSANPLAFEIEPGQRTSLRYEFFTEGNRIGLGDGGVEVSIGVTDTSQTTAESPVFDPAACDFANPTGCEELSCSRACPTNSGSFCLLGCRNILQCVSQQSCSTESDPLCAARTQGQPNICTNVVESAGGPNATNANLPAFVARQLVECSCSVPRPGTTSGECSAGQTRACGPAVSVGICRRGVQTCINGAFSACQGAVFAGRRDCTSPLDNDCDGAPDNTIDATCTCAIGTVQLCDDHPAFDGLGICRAGQRLCLSGPNNETSAFGTCVGSVGPLEQDSCDIPGDDSNCDGIANGGCPVATASPSFERDLWPIFQGQCSPCHSTLGRGGHFVGSADLATAFADATRLGSTLIDRLDGGGMPPTCQGLPGDPGCISIENLALIQLWIAGGMAP